MTTFIPGNKRQLFVGTQSAKGTAQTTPTKRMRVTDFTPNDVRQTLQLAETDASAQESADVVVAVTPGFSFKAYMRPSEFALFAASLLGNSADTGSTPNYTHTADPDDTQPYLTVYEVEPSVLCNQYVDCRVTSMTISGGAGQALEVTVTCEALSFAAGAAAPSSPAAINELPLTYPEVTITKGGATPGTFDSFEVTINRNSSRLQGDNGMASLDCQVGKFSVTGTASKFMEDDDDQRRVDTGTAAGTTPTTTIFTEAFSILVSRSSVLRVTLTMAGVSYKTRTAGVKTDGTPLVEVLGFRTLPQSTLASNLTIATKDQLATVDT